MRTRCFLPLALCSGALGMAQPTSAPHVVSSHGEVWVGPGAVDAPLAAGSRISTGRGGAAEIQIDPSNVLSLGPNSELHVTLVEPYHYSLELTRGALTHQIAGPWTASVDIATPTVSVSPAMAGAYRISVNPSRTADIIVDSGVAQVTAVNGAQWVDQRQRMQVRGTAADPEFRMMSAISRWRRFAMVVSAAMPYIQMAAQAAADSGSNSGSNRGDSHKASSSSPASSSTARPSTARAPDAPSKPPSTAPASNPKGK